MLKHVLAVLVGFLVAVPAVAAQDEKKDEKRPEKKEGERKDGCDCKCKCCQEHHAKKPARPDSEKPDKPRPDKEADERVREKKDCGLTAEQLKERLGRKLEGKDVDREILEHMKKHADGRCHCMCDHGVKKERRPDDEHADKKCEGHFHREGDKEPCHCKCDHNRPERHDKKCEGHRHDGEKEPCHCKCDHNRPDKKPDGERERGDKKMDEPRDEKRPHDKKPEERKDEKRPDKKKDDKKDGDKDKRDEK